MREFDRGSGVLVVLHGHGGDPSDARAWGRRAAPTGWEVVAPGAPRGDDDVRSWFGTGPRGADAGQLAAAVARLDDTVARVRAGGGRVAVAGFSQGAAVVLAAVRSGLSVDAAVAVRGFLPEVNDAPAPARAGDAPTPPVLVLAGARDEVVPEFLSTDAAAVLSGEGFAVETATDDAGHELTGAALEQVREFLTAATRRGVRVSLALPTDRVGAGEELLSAGAVTDLAAGYERLGFDACYVTDHPAPVVRWLASGGHHALEPTVALAVAAAATRHLLVHTNVYVLAYRNPFLAAKALASLDVVSGGRLVVGVAAGYLRGEFAALGAEFDDRGPELDRTLALLPRIWSGEVVSAEGDGWTAREVQALPSPAARPHPPLWIGGNSTAAMRRAVDLGQGWSPFPTPGGLAAATRTAPVEDLASLARRIERLGEMSAAAGRDRTPTVCFAPFAGIPVASDPGAPLGALVEEVAALEAMGVGWVTLSVPGDRRDAVLDRAAELAAALGLGRTGGN